MLNSPEIGVALVGTMTFLGLADWLLTARWRGNTAMSSLILLCTTVQAIIFFMAILRASYILATYSVVLLIAYGVAGYIGAERHQRRKSNGQ